LKILFDQNVSARLARILAGHDDSSGSGFDDCSTWSRAGGKVSWNNRTGELHVGSRSNTTITEPSNNGIVLTPVEVDAGSTVSLEHLDDVAIHTANGEITLEQTKSTLTQNPLSDWVADFWTTVG
jgi:hypothetical protein